MPQIKQVQSRPALEWIGLAALALLLGAAIVWHSASGHARVEAAERERLHMLANVLAGQIESGLGSTNRALAGVIADHLADPQQPGDPDRIARRLRALVEAMPAVRTLVVLDRDGKAIAASDAKLLGQQFGERPYFQVAMADRNPQRLYLSPPFTSMRGDRIIAASRVHTGPGGVPQALVVAALDPQYFQSLFAPLLYAPDLHLTLARADRPWLEQAAPPDGAQVQVTHAMQPPALQMEAPLRITLARSSEALAAPVLREARRLFAALAAGAVVAAALLAWVQKRRRQLAELDRRSAHERRELEAVFDNLNEAVLLFDREHRLVRANRAGRALHGLFGAEQSLAQLQAALEGGLLLLTAADGSSLAGAAWPTRRAAAGQPVRDLELEWQHRASGRSVAVEISTAPLRDASGNAGWVLTSRDVSERRQTLALRSSEARFRTLIEEAPLAIAILRGGHFLYTNPRYRLLHGYSASDDLQGLPWRAMLAPESAARLAREEALIRADSDTELKFEALGRGKAGELVPVFKATAQVALADGRATLVFVQDISAQKRAEADMLLARDGAERANRSKADFLANMSHEIRSPLNAILGLAYLLEQARLPADALDMVRRVRSAGSSLLGIVNDILDMSKIEAGHMQIEQAPFRLDELFDRLAGSMGVAVADKPVELLIAPLPPGIGMLRGDALRLEQVLLNLTSNAIKFTPSGRVELACAVLAHDSVRVSLCFSVRDTGIGIDPAIQADIFSPFTQADSSTTRRFGGTGLGLTICRQLVGLMGGTIGLDSSPAGSTFHFSLSFDDLGAAQTSAPITLLVVDDSDLNRAAVAALADAQGWRCLCAASGEAALAQLLALEPGARPDAVLLDWKMPGMDGMSTARALRALVGSDQCPVIMMSSAYALAELASEPDTDLIDAVLTKPLTGAALAKAVAEAGGRRVSAVRQTQAVAASGGNALAGLRLLVVDDSDFNRDLMGRILAGEGAQAEFAVDGEDALARLDAMAQPVDLVLMDVQMPVMDGLTATRRLRQHPRLHALPVIALTAGAFAAQREQALAAGVDHFVSKPFDVPKLVALIAGAVRREAVPADLAPPAPAPSSAPAAPAPAMDIAQGMAIWADLAQYRRYLDWFVGEYGAAPATLRLALAQDRRADACALAHKLAGVAGNLGLPATLHAACGLEQVLGGAAAPEQEGALAALDMALEQALAAIARFNAVETA